ncbi:hypothetical protein ABH926_006091 [Catenulispora sp. GP43]|uniref:hypothetical protein n=1 Tax=Catenulispora sp. GP43 TaxID=3156263 RepID=UPI0035184E6E
MDDTRKLLRQAAEAHEPDREAMLARIGQGMAQDSDARRARLYRRRRQASWAKISLAALAAVGVLGLGGLAVAAGVRQQAPEHPPAPVVVTPTGQAASSQPTVSSARPPASSGSSTPHHSAAPSSADGVISARADVNAHSTVYWSQNDLTVDVAQPLTAMTVELRIAQTGGIQSTGNWLTAPPDDFTVTVTPAGGYLVYRWVLKPGRTIPAAQQIFAAQFNHQTGKRDAGKDTFLVQATASGRTSEVRGDFPAGG